MTAIEVEEQRIVRHRPRHRERRAIRACQRAVEDLVRMQIPGRRQLRQPVRRRAERRR